MSDGISLRTIRKVDPQDSLPVIRNGDVKVKPEDDTKDSNGHVSIDKEEKKDKSNNDNEDNYEMLKGESQPTKPTDVHPSINDDFSSKSNLVDFEAQTSKLDDDDDDDDEEQMEATGCLKYVESVQTGLNNIWDKHGERIKWVLGAVAICCYAVYFAFAMRYEFGSESSVRLLWMTLLGVFIVFVMLVDNTCGSSIHKHVIQPPASYIKNHYKVFKISFLIVVIIGIILIILFEVALKAPINLVSAVGYVVFVLMFFVFSANPSKVRWRPVFWGLGLQFIFALLTIKTVWGYTAFAWLGDRITEFMAYTDEGSIFVFGESYEQHFFAMKVMPVVVFFSTVISVLYYLGIMEVVISKIAWVMQYTMGTTAAESTNAAGNIFIGQTEAPLLIRPLIGNMTNSEIHAVMVGGFATIAGSVLATYILLGVPANHLVTASVMAAPCALAMSKLSYPETKKTVKDAVAKMERLPYRNVIEAASAGASASIPLVANIIVNIIAFIAIIAFFNTTLTWMGHRVGLWAPEYPELTFQLLCSYILWPFAFLMGVARDDCGQVAELIGIKTFVNEFVAYTELGKLIDNTDYFNDYIANNGTDYVEINDDIYIRDKNVTLYGGVMEDRSIVISTYALCGFANVASIGTVIGALGSMAPDKKSDISSMAIRAMVTGTVVSFMNACMAGLLYEG